MGKFNQEYKKTYVPFILWLFIFISLDTFCVSILSNFMNTTLKVELGMSLAIMILAIRQLIKIIYDNEYVYWISGGPSFEEAKQSSSERRKTYALGYLNIFNRLTGYFFVYLYFSLVIDAYVFADVIVCVVLLLMSVIRASKIEY